MYSYKLASCFLLLFISNVSGQTIDNATIYKNIESDHFIRLNYENDFFVATDYYYTQGINLELVSPSLSKFPTSKALIKTGEVKYGMSIEHNGYTPTSIRHYEILYGDRPFCASLFLKFFAIGNDSVKNKRFSSSLSVGVVGEAAAGKWMQVSIHKWLHNIEPYGWDNQIHSDVILNYEVEDERLLLMTKAFLLSSYASVRGGTLSDKASAGITLMIGKFSSPFKVSGSVNRKYRLYVYDQPLINAVAYDATLQGGVFNHSSPYTIDAGDIQRITFQNNFGAVMTIGKINLSYYQSFLTKEFRTGLSHRWGGVSIAVAL